MDLRQSTAATVQVGVFVDDTDGKTPENALTITVTDIYLSKMGATWANINNPVGTLTFGTQGWYPCPFNTTDTNTLGRLQLAILESGALPVFHEFSVLPTNVWDSWYATDKLQVDTTQIEGADATDTLDERIEAVMGTARVTVGANNDKTGYSLAADQAVNTTKINGSDATATIDARIQKVMGTAKVTVGSNADKTGYSLAADQAVDTTKINGSDATATIDARIQAVMGTSKVTVGASNDKTGYSMAINQSAVTIGTVNIADSINKIEGTDATDVLDAQFEGVLGTAKVTVGANNDKTGYSLAADQQVDTTKIEGVDATNQLDARIQAVMGTARITVGADLVIGTAKVTVGSSEDKTGYRLSATGVDDILDESITEPSGAFAWASGSLRSIIGWVGALSRNKMTQTSGTTTLRNDADGGDISTSDVSDDGTTMTRGEWS